MAGEIERAQLFANVDELMEWKKTFEHKQRELIAWMASVDERIVQLNERIDVYNKRVRKLENASKMQGGELRALIRRTNHEKD